jgi:hypothetical protein
VPHRHDAQEPPCCFASLVNFDVNVVLNCGIDLDGRGMYVFFLDANWSPFWSGLTLRYVLRLVSDQCREAYMILVDSHVSAKNLDAVNLDRCLEQS